MMLGILISASVLRAQKASDVTVVDKQTLQALLQRIDQLEARVKQLENEKQASASVAPAAPSLEASPLTGIEKKQEKVVAESASTAVPQADSLVAVEKNGQQDEVSMGEKTDFNRTLLKIRGFGDMSVQGIADNSQTTSFSLGKLNLFVTSDISEKFKFLTEIVFEAGPVISEANSNVFGVDLERMLLQYTYNEYFHLLMGRNRTSIGYYNTAYHDSAWFQTAIAPPFLYTYENRGGILPLPIVGVSATGLIPSGSLGLHYIAEVGNGSASLLPTSAPVQNVVDENNHKAVNLAVFARPEAVPGVQVGFSWYNDLLTPYQQAKVSENIFATYAVIERPKFEWLNEGLLIRHAPAGSSHVYYTPGFYTTISKKFGRYQPYMGFQYVNASDLEPVFPAVGWQQGPYTGLRYNANESVAVKLQYSHNTFRHQAAENSLALQVAFTF